MTIRLPLKPLVAAMSEVRRKAMMGAAATALIAVTPPLHAAMPGEGTTLQLPPPGTRSIVISNGDDITVGADETALGHTSDQDDISLVNTGDLTGGIGIDVSTGSADLAATLYEQTGSFVFASNYLPLFDDAGNPVYGPGGYQQTVATAEITYNVTARILERDPLESAISIDNSGSIAFSGLHGIRATNPAGESIDIVNTGDVASTQDTAFRSGIFASTETFNQSVTETQTATGDFTYNAYGQLTGVNAPDEFTIDNLTVDMEYDAGSISIQNSGNIDMGTVSGPPDFYGSSPFASVGIHTVGDGGTTIVNTGDIRVDRFSVGIHASSTAATSIVNAGRIDIGNLSSAISVGTSRGNAGDYRLGGDVYVLNTGEIHGGVTRDQGDPLYGTSATGIYVFALGSNNEYLAGQAHVNEIFSRYNELLGYEAYELFDVPNTRLYDTTVVNRGQIELLDGARGIAITPRAGYSTAINEGTIIVGDGYGNGAANFNIPSAGILQANFSVGGMGTTASLNAEPGVIVTGDDSIGIGNYNIGGTSIAINEGSITTGDGITSPLTTYAGTYDRLFQSRGILSISAAATFGTTSYAANRGNVTVGDLAVGMFVSGQGFSLLDPLAPTAINVNQGIIETGDNSSGMFTTGYNAVTYNSGSITTGNYDIGAFQPHPEYTADEFAQVRYGAATSGLLLADVINNGTITTGDGTIGASARMTNFGGGLGARLTQGETGVIETGDASIGARIAGNYYGALYNGGRISAGGDSVGVDLTAGSVVLRYGYTSATVVEGTLFAANSGIIETGDNSVGIRMNAVHEDVAYAGSVLVFDPPGCSPYYPPCSYAYVDVSGTADSIGSAYLVNAGAIRVGANSTAVEITGEAANEQGLHLFNTGTISAGAGTAIRLNAGNDIDSYVVNVGAITGDIVFGAGDDRLVNTQFVDDFGQLISTGNITMVGSTIDFGAGTNRFENDRGVITVAGGENLITGAALVMTDATIEARNGVIGSRLTINGNVSGSFLFGTDVSGAGADQLVITGDVADGSAMGIVLNPTEQFRGATEFAVITVDGENGAGVPVVAGVTGGFADSLLGTAARFDEATGQVFVTATFGMGHMATTAASATTMAQHWWMQSAGSFEKRNMHRLAGANDTGLSVWGSAFHDEGTISPDNALQNAGFDQKLSGLQTGIQWTQDLGGGSFSVSPMFSYGDARASQNANLGSATGDAMAYGLNANYILKNGLYFDATWQKSTIEIDFRTPGTLSNARGETDADGDGFNVEMGYSYKLKSGLTLAPQVQYGDVRVDLDDFASSDGVYDFSDVGGRLSLLRAGVSVFKTFETKNGSITPLADLNYLYATEGDSELFSNGLWFANDTTGSGYSAEFGLAGRYKSWDISGRVGLADTSASEHLLSTNVTVRYRW
jgi:outer membrane autotransporter protein